MVINGFYGICSPFLWLMKNPVRGRKGRSSEAGRPKGHPHPKVREATRKGEGTQVDTVAVDRVARGRGEGPIPDPKTTRVSGLKKIRDLRRRCTG